MAEGYAVRLERIVRDLRDLPGLGVEAIDRLLLIRLQRARIGELALVDADRAIAGIGEPDRLVVGMHHHVVRAVERLAASLLGQRRDRTVVLVTNEAGAFG